MFRGLSVQGFNSRVKGIKGFWAAGFRGLGLMGGVGFKGFRCRAFTGALGFRSRGLDLGS